MNKVSDQDKDWIDLGSNVYAKFHTCSHKEPVPSGARIRFAGEIGVSDYCEARINWCKHCVPPLWELKSLNPLHVEPSLILHCRRHLNGHHGWIRAGKWQEV